LIEDEIEDLLRREILANLSLETLMDRVLTGHDSEEALEMCKRLSNGYPDPNPSSTVALEYSRLMRNALREEEFRWLHFERSDRACKQMRRDRIVLYRRLKALFDLEIRTARRQKRCCMALAGDWSKLGDYLRESFAVARYRCLLSVAGLLFRVGIPGAGDVCDAAVFGIFRTIYFAT
jgi:hypothetical protein